VKLRFIFMFEGAVPFGKPDVAQGIVIGNPVNKLWL
jgi:hypothetical protein